MIISMIRVIQNQSFPLLSMSFFIVNFFYSILVFLDFYNTFFIVIKLILITSTTCSFY